MRKRAEIPTEELIEKYEKGVSITDLAKKYRVACSTITRRIDEYYEKKSKEKPKRERTTRKKLPMEEIIEKYENGIFQKDLAKEYGVSINTMSRRIEEYYQKQGKRKPKINVIRKKMLPIEEKTKMGKIELPIEEIIEKYEQGEMPKNLAKEYGVGCSTMTRRIEEYYEKKGKDKPKRERIKECSQKKEKKTKRKKYTKIESPIEEIIEKYEKGISKKQLAEEYDVSYGVIEKIIKEAYKENGKKVPRVLRSVNFILDFLNRGLTIEEIKESAAKKNVIISQDAINAALDKFNSKNQTCSDDGR